MAADGRFITAINETISIQTVGLFSCVSLRAHFIRSTNHTGNDWYQIISKENTKYFKSGKIVDSVGDSGVSPWNVGNRWDCFTHLKEARKSRETRLFPASWYRFNRSGSDGSDGSDGRANIDQAGRCGWVGGGGEWGTEQCKARKMVNK